jgi:catechol 2,3-dioxygenase-like lactoylglutathione lyase family enzyme
MSTTEATFTTVITVAVPVSDQDRSKAFFEALGFSTRLDVELQPGFRWIEVAPPGAGTSVALVHTHPGLPTGIDTGIRLGTPDARAAHKHCEAQGLQVGELLDWETAPLMFEFRDFDGNRMYVTQTD